MRLMDEEDLLESGIEIVARPPASAPEPDADVGRREGADCDRPSLRAVPDQAVAFCILDEVDAPLDDVNTLRFVGNAQAAVAGDAVHRDHPQQAVDGGLGTLYGVTMEERGVSKLVAVQLEELQPETAAASA